MIPATSATLMPPLRLVTRPTYWHCEPGWEWRSRPLQDFLLWYVIDGAGQMALDGHTWSLRTGVCFVFAPGMAPHGTQDPQRRLVVFGMHFDVPLGLQLAGQAAWLPPPGHLVRDPAYFGVLAHQCDVAFRRGDALAAEQCRLYLQLMILHMAAEAQSGAVTAVDRALDELAHAIQREPGRRWSVAEMAGIVHLSPAQLTRRFRTATGLSPTRFVIQARVERARQLLHETDMSISQIASALGYDDLFFFSRQYKHYTGRPPSEERRNADR